MKIALLGYGKMGKTIEAIALKRGHTIVAKIDHHNKEELEYLPAKAPEICIEFSQPEVAFRHLEFCMKNGLAVVCGTTGWVDKKSIIEDLCHKNKGAFFYASNFSIGVNLFFELNKKAARLMNPYPSYDVEMTEIHHIHKKDSPSGTALTLADGIFETINRKKTWEENPPFPKDSVLSIFSAREGEVPGTHAVRYFSEIDEIEIIHKAYSREGFAEGAVVAAEWLLGKKGVFSMKNLIGL